MSAYMARLRIEEMLKKRGITAYRLAVDAGLAHHSLARLRKGTATQVRFDVLDQLCSVLNCEPNDLIELKSKSPKKKGK